MLIWSEGRLREEFPVDAGDDSLVDCLLCLLLLLFLKPSPLEATCGPVFSGS